MSILPRKGRRELQSRTCPVPCLKEKELSSWALEVQEGITQLTINLQIQWLFNQCRILISQRRKVRQAFSFFPQNKSLLVVSRGHDGDQAFLISPGQASLSPCHCCLECSLHALFFSKTSSAKDAGYFIRSDLAWIHLLSRSVSPPDPSPKAPIAHSNSHRHRSVSFINLTTVTTV